MHARKLSLGRWGLAGAMCGAVLFAAAPSFAQNAEASASASTTGISASSSGTGATATGDSDHDKFVGSFAVGYLGASLIPVATNATVDFNGAPIGVDAEGSTVSAPVVGIRYWLNDMIGIDAGLGFRNATGKVKHHYVDPRVPAGATAPFVETDFEEDEVSQMGVLLHAGLPLALNTEKHFVFEVIPEANVGFASGTYKFQTYTAPNAAAPAVVPDDIKLSGFRLDIGARAGAELHFGFIGVPNLSLQAGVGLYLSMEKYKAEGASLPPTAATGNVAVPKTSVQVSHTTISTSVNNDPWAIFTNNVSALYYF